MFNFHKKEDKQVKLDVENEIRWDPSITATDITATASDGVVTLYGTVPHYVEKLNIEDAAERVSGVRGVNNQIEVNLIDDYYRDDVEILTAAKNAIKWDYQAPEGITVSVNQGWITLHGEADWDFERKSAHDAVSTLMGVQGVTNKITIKSQVLSSDVKVRIEDALKRTAESDAKKIKVNIQGNQVKLTGSVQNCGEIQDAKNAAWSAPGVMDVTDDLEIAA